MTDSTATAPAAVLENALGRTRGKSKYFFGVALALFAFVVLFYVVTIAKIGGNIASGAGG